MCTDDVDVSTAARREAEARRMGDTGWVARAMAGLGARRLRRARPRIAVALASLALAAVGLAGVAPQARAATVPNPDINSYVLFGFNQVAFKGGQGNHGPSIIDGGNIGANGSGFINGNNPRVNVCANAQMVMSDNTMVVGATMRAGDASTPTLECNVYQEFYNTPVGNPETPRSGPATPFTPPVIKASPPFPDFACDPANPVTVVNGTPFVLPPGVYGAVNFQNGSAVTLLPGVYTFCTFTSGQHVTVNAPPGVTIRSEQQFLLNDDAAFGGSDCATIPTIYVRGTGVSANDNTVRFGQDSTVWGHFYAPNGNLNLGNQTDLHGTFWADAIASDFNVDVEYCPPPFPEQPTGSISVTKQVSGAVVGAPPDATYAIHYDCTLPGPGLRDALDQVLEIQAGQTITFTDVEVGTTCTGTEVDRPPPLPGYVYEPPVFTPSNTIVVSEEGQLVSVVVDNPLREIFGQIQVAKTVSGDTAGYVPQSVFSLGLDCSDDTFDTTFGLAAGQTFTSDPIRVGVPCTVTETDRATPASGFEYRPPVFTPSPPTVTIGAENQVVSVAVDNPIVRLVGTVQVHKVVSGDTAGYAAGTLFGFSLDCDDNAFDTTFELAANATFTSGPIPVGTTCTVAESNGPAPIAGFTYADPIFTPSPPTATITSAGQVIDFRVDNPLVGPTPTPTPTPSAPIVDPGTGTGTGEASAPSLSFTGAPLLALAGLGAALLIAGAALTLSGSLRRRRAEPGAEGNIKY